MIYDAFTFFNELDLLEIRLNVLDKVVDKFVLVEGNRTFNNQPKEMIFSRRQSEPRFAPFRDRIIVVAVTEWPEFSDAWQYEYHQRNCILKGLTDCRSEDVVIVSDLDEIPAPEAVKAYDPKDGMVFLEQMLCYYYFNNVSLMVKNTWRGSAMTGWADFAHGLDGLPNWPEYGPPFEGRISTPQRLRMLGRLNKNARHIKNAGWHFSYLMSTESISKKISSFAHQEYNKPEYTELQKIDARIKSGRSITGALGDLFCPAPLDAKFPDYIRNNRVKYEQLILPVSPWVTFSRHLRFAAECRLCLTFINTVKRLRRSVAKRLGKFFPG